MADIQQQILDELKTLNGNRQRRDTIGASPPGQPGLGGFDMTGALSLLKGGITGLKDAAVESLDVWRASSNIGIGFNNDAIGLRTSIASTRLGVDEWGQVIDRGKIGFTSLAGSMGESAKAFNRLSSEFSREEFGESLNKMGYSTKEFNEVLMLSVLNKRLDTRMDSESNIQAREAAYNLATEMDKVAQLTGVSRRAQMDALQEQQRDARLQATFAIQMAQGGKNLADDYKVASSKLQGLGLEQVGKELFVGQQLTEKTIAIIATLGPAGTELRSAMTDLKRARSDTEREAAQLRVDAATAAVATVQSQKSYQTLVAVGEGRAAEGARESYISGMNFRKALESVRQDMLDKNIVMTNEEALAEARRRADLAQKGKDEEGKPVPGAKTTELAIQATNRLKDAFASAATIVEAFNNRIGTESITKQLLDQTRNVKVDESGKATSFQGRLEGEWMPKLIESINRGEAMKELPTVIAQASKQLAEATLDVGTSIGKSIVDTMGPMLTELFTSLKSKFLDMAEPRDLGTVGMTGKLWEDPGLKMVGSGVKETTVTEDQLKNLIAGTANLTPPSIPSEVSSLLNSMQIELSNPKKQGFDNSGINLLADTFRNIQTSISAANAPSKSPDDNLGIIIAEQQRQQAELIAKTSNIAANMQPPQVEVTPIPGMETTFSTFFRDFSNEIPQIGQAIKESFASLASIAPATNNQQQAKDLARTIPNEIKQARAEEQRQEQNRKQDTAQLNASSDRITEPNTTFNTGTATLDDLKELLIQLNSTMGSTVGELSNLVNSSEKQVRATKRMDPNVATR
jgi:hypothetical protein